MTLQKLEHTEFLKSLSDDERNFFTDKSDFRGVAHFLGKFACIIACAVWISAALPGWQLVMVVLGILLVFLFTLLHETVHMTPFDTPALNRWIGWFCALIILLPPKWFQYFHLAHHRHTHEPGKDPELDAKEPETWLDYLWVVSGIPVWKFHIVTLVNNALGRCTDSYVPKKGLPKVKQEARMMIGIYLLIAIGSIAVQSALLIYIWIIPLLLGQPFLRLYLMAEHNRCPHVANMFENTRTTYTNMMIRWLATNMPYHAEHHAYPSVPFHKLKAFHNVAKDHLKMTENGYVGFHRKTIEGLNK